MRVDLWNILEPVHVDPARKSWKDVLRNLVFHSNLQGCAWPSIATIRSETGYKSDKAITDALAGLKEAGIISPMPESPTGGGRGRVTKWLINNLSTYVHKLTSNSNIPKRDSPKKGEVTSEVINIPERDKVKRVKSLPKKGEVTSKKGEVTSARNNIEIIREVSKLVSAGQKGELTSPFVDNSAGDGKAASAEGRPPPHGAGPRQIAPSARKEPRQMDLKELFPGIKPDYIQLCSKLGWKPNDPAQTPPEDAELARRSVVTCAYREGLSPAEAKRFLRYNAKRKWAAIDQANCVKDLAKEFCEAWKRRDIDAFWAEVDRRREAERARAAARQP